MENSHRKHRGDLQQRSFRVNSGTVPISASSSSNLQAIMEHTRAHLSVNNSLSNMYSFARPNIVSYISMEPSMFMAGSSEPSSPGLCPDRQIMGHNRACVTSSYDYYSTPYQQFEITPFEYGYSTQNSFMNPNIATFEPPLLGDNAGQSLLRRQTSTFKHGSDSLSHAEIPYSPYYSPTSRIKSRGLATQPAVVNHARESTSPASLSPAVTRPKRSLIQPSRKLSADNAGNHDRPYAYLLYKALLTAKDYKMSLQEIYRWFEENTNKTNDPQSKGWQSSIRHNLSMNEAFILHNDYPARGKSKNNYWTLTEEALKNGVQSTTRYRNNVPKRPLTFDDMTRQLREVGGKGGSDLGHAGGKSRRISHYADVDYAEQYQSIQGYDIQQQLAQRKTVDDTSKHNVYYQDSSTFVSQNLNPSVIITSTLACDGPQYGYVETHHPSDSFGQDITQFDT